MIAGSLYVRGGVRLIKPTKLHMRKQNLQTQDGRMTLDVHGHGSVAV